MTSYSKSLILYQRSVTNCAGRFSPSYSSTRKIRLWSALYSERFTMCLPWIAGWRNSNALHRWRRLLSIDLKCLRRLLVTQGKHSVKRSPYKALYRGLSLRWKPARKIRYRPFLLKHQRFSLWFNIFLDIYAPAIYGKKQLSFQLSYLRIEKKEGRNH